MSGTGQPMFARITKLIKMPKDQNGCWEWIGGVRNGYGLKRWGGKSVQAHRWVYEMFNGMIRKNMVIDHLCKNTTCVNPAHLEVVTVAINARRGTGTVLTLEQVKQIKKAGVNRKWGDGAKLAREMGIKPSLILDLWNGYSWQ